MKTTAIIITLLLTAWQSYAQEPAVVSNNEGWEKIGEANVRFSQDGESIAVMGADEFSALKFKVTDAPIHIDRVQVFYESGDKQELEMDSELLAGAETKEFQLEQKDRDIQKVEFTYRTTSKTEGDKAHVELYGMKTDVQKNTDAYHEEKVVEKSDSAVNQAGQELNDAAENIEDDIENGSERITNDTMENPQNNAEEVSKAAAEAAANMTDKKVEGKVGPEDQTIYIDKDSNHYYINDEGTKVIIDKQQLKNKRVD